MKEQLRTMIEMQRKINASILEKAKEIGKGGWNKNFAREAMLECAEAIEHLDHKWWKSGKDDLMQVKLEVVDIWHFQLSIFIYWINQGLESTENIFSILLDVKHEADTNPIQLSLLKMFTKLTGLYSQASGVGYGSGASAQKPVYKLLFNIMNQLEMSWEELYGLYVGKNILNRFRQDHGYAEGKYIKTWGDVEDNVVLAKIVNALTRYNRCSEDKIYALLSTEYADLCVRAHITNGEING